MILVMRIIYDRPVHASRTYNVLLHCGKQDQLVIRGAGHSPLGLNRGRFPPRTFPPSGRLPLLFECLGRFPPRPVTTYYQSQRQAGAEISCITKSNSAFEVSSPLSIFQTQRVLVGATINSN